MGTDPESSTDEWEAPHQRSGDVSGTAAKKCSSLISLYFECRICEDITGTYLAFLFDK